MRALILTAAVVLLAACKPAPTDTAAPVAVTPATAAAPASPEAPAPEPGAVATPAPTGAPTAPVSDEGSAQVDAQVNQSIEEVLGDPAIYEPAIRAFQKAVAAHDVVAVARMADYPFNATIDGKPAKIKDAAAFAAAYDKIVTPAIAKVVSEQKYAELAVSGKGVMFGNGEAWINGICKDNECKAVDVRVVAIQASEAAAH